MSAKNEARLKTAYVLLTISVFLLLFGWFTDSGLGFFAFPVGVLLLFVGTIMVTSVAIINGVPWVTRLISRFAEPVWEGEIIHTDGSGYKIRYDFDGYGIPWFVASDVCTAIGAKIPTKGMMKCGDTPLLPRGENVCFSEENVQAYLIPLAINNRAANRLLVNIRDNILHKLEKQRDDKKRYG